MSCGCLVSRCVSRCLGVSRGCLGDVSGVSRHVVHGGVSEVSGVSRRVSGVSRGCLGGVSACLGVSRRFLEVSRGCLGVSRGVVGVSWGCLGLGLGGVPCVSFLGHNPSPTVAAFDFAPLNSEVTLML